MRQATDTVWGSSTQFSTGEARALSQAHLLRVEQDDYAISDVHIADALEILTAGSTSSLSEDRSPKDPYGRGGGRR